jgi:AraC-like DNA-binding protein
MLINLLEILIFGSLVLLGIMLIANPLKLNKKANIWFGIFLLLWATFWIEEILSLIRFEKMELGSLLYLRFIQFLTPVTFFISIRYFTNPGYRIGRNLMLYLAIPCLYLLLLILDNFLIGKLQSVLLGFILIHGFAYTWLSLFRIGKHKKRILHFSSNTVQIDLTWIESIVWAMMFLVSGVIVFNLVFYEARLNLFMNGFVYAVVLFTAYHSQKQKEIFPDDTQEWAEALLLLEDTETDSIQNKIMTDEKLVEEKSRLNEFLLKEEPYLDTELSLGKLAKMLNLTSHQLSYIINNGFNQNFNGFINKFRVEKAKKLLVEDRKLDTYSIIGIAFDSGFNSKTSFNTAFKKITGLTPSEFKNTRSDL